MEKVSRCLAEWPSARVAEGDPLCSLGVSSGLAPQTHGRLDFSDVYMTSSVLVDMTWGERAVLVLKDDKSKDEKDGKYQFGDAWPDVRGN